MVDQGLDLIRHFKEDPDENFLYYVNSEKVYH